MSYSIEEIENALGSGEFLFHYQPQVDFITGAIGGAEALLRWRNANGDLIEPAHFLPVAERHDFVPEITRHTFPRLAEDFQRIQSECPGFGLSFNVSARDLDTPVLLDIVREHVDSGAIDPFMFEIEITEGSRISDNLTCNHTITGLLADGISLAMDDYGTGFSSLETLNRLPFSAIKLDQSFVLKMLRSSKTATLVKTSIAAAQMLGIKTVIEGIESEPVYRSLLHSGCTQGQGFWISPPLPLPVYLDFLKQNRNWPRSPVGMLRMAQITHTWQYKLLVDLVCSAIQKESENDALLEQMHIDHHQCALGRWYYGAGQELAGDPDFDALAQPHRDMHDTCEKMVEILGNHRGFVPVKPLLKELSSNAILVTACLERLETRMLIEELDEGP